MFQASEFRAAIRVNKFFPPEVETPQHLNRRRIIEPLLRRDILETSVLIVEARAGQGKSTFVKQYLNCLDGSSAWYQVSPEDADPWFFLAALPSCLGGVLPDYPSPSIVQYIASSDYTSFELQGWLDLLLEDLRNCLEGELTLVFDDLHALLPHADSLMVLNYLLTHAPPKLHFILVSREQLVPEVLPALGGKCNLRRLGNHELAMDEREISELFQRTLQLELCLESSSAIARSTEGWVMGVLLLGRQMERKRESSLQDLLSQSEHERPEILDYFRKTIFSPLDAHLHLPLLKLSFLDEIPVELAIEITGIAEIGSELRVLARRNLFIRPLDAERNVFGMHHLFQEFLQDRAREELDLESIRFICRQVGEFYLRNGDPARGLRYLVRSNAGDAVEAALKTYGMAFLARNQTATLSAILVRTPQEQLRQQGWASFFQALARLDSSPEQALPLLDQALNVFAAKADRIGELLCLAHIISIDITTTGYSPEGESLLNRAEQLFKETADTLDAATTILVVRSLAMGCCIFLADIPKAKRFASLALNLARKEQSAAFEAALLLMNGYIEIFAGRTAPARMFLEQAATFLGRPEVGSFNDLAIRMMLCRFLYIDGDFANYFAQKQQLINAFGFDLFSQSTAGPFCSVWEMDIALCRGCLANVKTLADRIGTQFPSLSPHLLSQVLQFKALALALEGHSEQALANDEKARRLRQMTSGPFFEAVNCMLSGLTYFHCGQHDQALEYFCAGIGTARRISIEYLEACGVLHRAGLYLEAGAVTQAEEDIGLGLELMRRNGYRHFWAWTPSAMQSILSFAVARRIEVEFARNLAAERLNLALDDDGSPFPLLEFRTLGTFKILCQGNVLLHAEELTPAQRELLCLLLAAEESKLPQETIQLHFWPDSSPDTVKVNFDTMVSRLRKVLAGALSGGLRQRYLNREKGMVWLAHCRVDARDFLDAVRHGQRHLRRQEFWQAGNAFAEAEALWQGDFVPGATGEEQVRHYRGKLNQAMTELAIDWCNLLTRTDRVAQGLQVVEKALECDPFNDRLYALLYHMNGKSSAIGARRVLRRFGAVLAEEGYPPAEIKELLAEIISTPDPLKN